MIVILFHNKCMGQKRQISVLKAFLLKPHPANEIHFAGVKYEISLWEEVIEDEEG